MKPGLTKRQKTTGIYFDEASKTVEFKRTILRSKSG